MHFFSFFFLTNWLECGIIKFRVPRPHRVGSVVLILGGIGRIFSIGFPHATALIGLPANGSAGSGEILGGDLCGLLGLGVADFVVEHFDYLSFISECIIAYLWGFVKHYF